MSGCSEVPEIEVHMIKSTDKIGGTGNRAPPLAPAVANAFFNATGVRIRRIPLTPARVLEALKKAEANLEQEINFSSLRRSGWPRRRSP